MKLYDSRGPNPRIVRMFMAERGITVPTEAIDIRGGDSRTDAYRAVNPFGQTPALVLDTGQVVTEVVAICEYLDEVSPGPSLIGATPEARAETRRWLRWGDLNICEPITNAFRYGAGREMYASRIRTLPEAVDGLIAIARDNIGFLDAQLAERDFVAGDALTLADIHLFSFIDFGESRHVPLGDGVGHVRRWLDRMAARPSAAA